MKNKERLIVTLIAIAIFGFINVGYATYNLRIGNSGEVSFGTQGNIAIDSVRLVANNNLRNPVDPVYTDDSISFDLNFVVSSRSDIQSKTYNATYEVTIKNDSFYDYAFASSVFQPSIETSSNENMVVTYSIDGIELNEIIESGESRTFTIRIDMFPSATGSFNVTGDAGVGVEEKDEEGSLLASIPRNSTGDLSGDNQITKVTATVINSYKNGKTFTFSLSNKNFALVDRNGNPLGSFSIDSNSEQTYDLYIKKNTDKTFPTDTQSMNVYFDPVDGSRQSMGVVLITVDQDISLVDDEAPEVWDVSSTFLADKGSVQVDFSGEDNLSGVAFYTIETYKVNGSSETKVATNRTQADETSIVITGLSDGNYYFKVYGTDNVNQTATSSQISSCTTSRGKCSKSSTSNYKWTFSITNNLTNASSNGSSTIDYGETYTATISGTGNYNSPSSLTVTMGGETLTAGSNYTYNADSGSLSIPNVTGDITITGSGRNTCFVEGTKIRLANGKYKNIENITYQDLLSVWNFDTGKLTSEYPLWIEKRKRTKEYTKITFSDNSSISVVGMHAFYNTDVNAFVNVTDSEHFKVGSKIAKVVDNDLVTVKVKKIEKIKKAVNYYFVASTAYFDVIANDFLTTDGNTILSNRYGFLKGAIWPKNKLMKVMDYTYFKDILPYYMYVGFRAGEVGILLNNSQTTLSDFKKYLTSEIINPEMVLSPVTKNGKRYWMVTTSSDKVINKDKYLVREGATYVLPKVRGVKGWLCTSDNKIYKPGDRVKVWHGLHFVRRN